MIVSLTKNLLWVSDSSLRSDDLHSLKEVFRNTNPESCISSAAHSDTSAEVWREFSGSSLEGRRPRQNISSPNGKLFSNTPSLKYWNTSEFTAVIMKPLTKLLLFKDLYLPSLWWLINHPSSDSFKNSQEDETDLCHHRKWPHYLRTLHFITCDGENHSSVKYLDKTTSVELFPCSPQILERCGRNTMKHWCLQRKYWKLWLFEPDWKITQRKWLNMWETFDFQLILLIFKLF